MDLGLSGATAVVQGGTQGMGRAAAECLAADGAKVAVLARTQADLDTTVARLRDLGAPDAVSLRADITKNDQVVAAFEQVRERWGTLNILVNATGPAGIGSFEQLTDDDWFATIDIGSIRPCRVEQLADPCPDLRPLRSPR
jgi:3-oxoacyl-[acyl-carrier protein] reductase